MRLGDALAAENKPRPPHGGRTPGRALCSLHLTYGVAAGLKAMRPRAAALGRAVHGLAPGARECPPCTAQPGLLGQGPGQGQAAGSDRVYGAGWERTPGVL